MILSKFKQEIKKSNFQLCIIHGDSTYLKEQALAAILASENNDGMMLDVERFDGKADESDIILACDTLPFIQQKRIVCVNDYSGLIVGGKSADKMNAYIQDMPEHVILIFMMTVAVDKRKKLYKTIKSIGIDADFATPSDGEISKWVIAECANLGKVIKSEHAYLMTNICGQDMVSLKGEIAKVCAYAKKDTITSQDIRFVVSKSLEYNVFLLHDFLLKKDISKALGLLHEIIETEKSPIGILGLIASKFRLMVKARALVDAKYPKDRAISLIGGHPYAAKMALSECRSFTSEQLRDGINQLAKLDYQLKTGRTDSSLTVETTLLKIYQVTA